MNRGYFFVAFGKQYIEEVKMLVNTLRKVGDTLPISVLTSNEDFDYCKSLNIFDEIIVYDFNNELSLSAKTAFEKYGAIPKILMLKLTPYDESIFVDSDTLCQYNPENVWNLMRQKNQAVCTIGLEYSPDWHFGFNHIVSENLGKNVPETHTGIVYWNKNNSDFDKFYDTLINVWNTYDSYKLLKQFRGGRVEEPVYAVTFALMNYLPIDGTKYAIMTHNYHSEIKLPSNIITGGIMYNILTKLDSPIPFIHMFKDNRGAHYEIIYNKLMNM